MDWWQSEEYSLRVVEALERIARGNEAALLGGPFKPPAPPRRVRWTLNHFRGDSCQLTNAGDATAHDVTVTADQSLPLMSVPPPADVRPDEAWTFLAAPSFGTNDSTITVGWTDDEVDP